MFRLASFLKIFVIYFLFSEVFCIAKWYMHTLCRRFMIDYGGELVLDESLFPRHQDSCFVTIVGNGSQHSKISFFFSSFHVGPDCQGNVTLVDGIADLYTRKIRGLEKSLCKYDVLDERSIFETSERYLGVLFHRRRDRWRTSSNVSLTIKFVSFQNQGEPCDPDDTGKMHSCSNGRCINNDVICRGLNPCGDFSDVCEDSGLQQTTAKVVLSTSKYIIIGVGAFVGLLCLAQGCFIVRRCCCSSKDDDDETPANRTKNLKQKIPPDIHQEQKPLHSEDGHDTIEDSLAEESLEDRLASESLLNDTGVTDIDSEIKYQTDSEKDSLEEMQHKLSPAIDTHTNLKRAYV